MQTCAICGANAATTKDHIPPKGLYSKPRVNGLNLNTVPACPHCNNGSSPDDEIFKVLIGIDTGEHQDAPTKVIEALAGTISKNARVAHQVFSTQEHVLANLRGKLLEPAVSVTFDFGPYERVVTRIVRGLHWMETDRVLAKDAKVTVLPGNQISEDLGANFMQLLQLAPLRKLNNETFMYRCHLGNDGVQIWGMQFFSQHIAFAYVNEAPPIRAEA